MAACGKSRYYYFVRINMIFCRMLTQMCNRPGKLAECRRIVSCRSNTVMQNNSVVTGSDKLQRNRLCLTLGHPFITAARADHDDRTHAFRSNLTRVVQKIRI